MSLCCAGGGQPCLASTRGGGTHRRPSAPANPKPRSRYPRSFRFLTFFSSQREQAEEGQYIRRREQELLKAAQEKLKAAQAEVDKHQATVDASNAKDKK